MVMNIKGVYTALITPFKEDFSVDYDKYLELIERQFQAGIHGVVLYGTTGERPTLEYDEILKITELVVKNFKGKIQIIANVGTNNTKESIKNAIDAEKLGVDALLVVNPYYNKPTQKGMQMHFKMISESIRIPVILYNIKGRTGVNFEVDSVLSLVQEQKNIIAIKESSGDLNQITDIINKTRNLNFSVLSGDDSINFDIIKRGGTGAVSVISNIIPEWMVYFYELMEKKEYEKAKKLHEILKPFSEASCSIGNNPIASKTLMAEQGLINEIMRMPLCNLDQEEKDKLMEIFSTCNKKLKEFKN